jgi:hypothetical protein
MGILRRRTVVIAFTTIIAITALQPEYSSTITTLFGVLGTFLTAGSMAFLNDILRSATGEEIGRELASLIPDTEQGNSLSDQQILGLADLVDSSEVRKTHEICASCLRARFIWGTAVPMALFILVPLYANPATVYVFGRRPKLSLLEDSLLFAFQIFITIFQLSAIGKIVSSSTLHHQYEHQHRFIRLEVFP